MKKILIIEDDSVLGDILNQKLAGAGYSVELAPDGLKGYSRIGEWMPVLFSWISTFHF